MHSWYYDNLPEYNRALAYVNQICQNLPERAKPFTTCDSYVNRQKLAKSFLTNLHNDTVVPCTSIGLCTGDESADGTITWNIF